IAGEFNSINGTNRNFIARLNANGSLDTSFDPGPGPNAAIFAMALQSDGKVVIGGDFTSVDGTPRNRIARLNGDGTFDATFEPFSGADDTVYAVAVQPNGKVLVGGAFTTMDLRSRSRIARLDANGTLDLGFNP